jgi:hypothetical protein
MLTLEQIEVMSPREAWRELQNFVAVLPLLMVKAAPAMTAGDDVWLTAGEVARWLNVSESYVRERAKTDVRWAPFSKKMGNAWRFKRFEFERFVNESKSRDL